MSVIYKATSTPTISDFGTVALTRATIAVLDAVTLWPEDKMVLNVSASKLIAPVSGVYAASIIVPPTSVIQNNARLFIERNGKEIKRRNGNGTSPINALDAVFYCHDGDEIALKGFNMSGVPVQWDNLELVVAKIG